MAEVEATGAADVGAGIGAFPVEVEAVEAGAEEVGSGGRTLESMTMGSPPSFLIALAFVASSSAAPTVVALAGRALVVLAGREWLAAEEVVVTGGFCCQAGFAGPGAD